jgi:hypothetical protein
MTRNAGRVWLRGQPDRRVQSGAEKQQIGWQ